MSDRGQAIRAMAAELRAGERFLLTTHEGPDGDALGSLLAAHRILQSMGKDSVMFLAAKEFPLPVEYRFLPLEEVFHEEPADLSDRTLLFLDCGNIDRMPIPFLQRDDLRVLNVDHHHDNTRFGSVDLVDDTASSTAEIVYELAVELGVSLSPDVAEALYVGIVTDTGRFMYESTSARTHRIVAGLMEAGVETHEVYRRLYEKVPIEKVLLTARALNAIEVHEQGTLGVTYVGAADYRAVGATGELTEGIIDEIRAIEGLRLAALVRDRVGADGARRKVSLRSTDGTIDVSAIAREHGGGGHTRAAGFSTDLPYEEIVTFLREQVHAQAVA
ncbi:MAG: DHH family phosphoesterase [Solirubrobacterales bacterium]